VIGCYFIVRRAAFLLARDPRISQGLGNVPECRFDGPVMPSSGRTRVASRALRRSAAAMLRQPWRRRMPMARLRRLAMVWGGAGADLGGVLGEGGVAGVVQRLDAPMPSDVVGQAGGACLGGGEAGDRVDRHGVPPPAVQGSAPPVAGIGDLGEATEQTTALGRVPARRARPAAGRQQKWEMMSR
jgi:hypothetical protein